MTGAAPTAPRVAVVGAGISGLAAAYELTRAGAAVTVLDAAPRPGGPILTTPFCGIDLDAGPDAFLARVPHGAELCRELGLADDLVAPATRHAYVWADGRLCRFPERVLLGVPTDLDALAASGVVSAAGVRRAAEDLERADDGPPPGADEAVAELVRRRLGAEVLDRLVDPLLSGIFAGDTEQLSLLAGAPQIAAAAQRGGPSLIAGAREVLAAAAASSAASTPGGPEAPVFLTLRGGLGRLVDALASAIGPAHLRLGTPVRSIDRAPDRSLPAGPPSPAVAHYTLGIDDSGALDADAVILATPAPVTARLVADLAPGAAALLDEVRYASVSLVSFAYRVEEIPRPLDGSGFLVPRSAGLLMTACSWASSKFAHLGGDGWARLRVSAGRIDDERADALDDDALVAALRADLRATMGIDAPPTAQRVGRWPHSLPQYTVGHLDRLRTIEGDLAHRAPGLVATGAAFRGVGLPACIAQGREAARQILSLFG